MVSFDDAFEKAKKVKNSISLCSEMDNAYIFYSQGEKESEGGPNTPCIVIKATGEVVSMPLYINEYGYGKEIRDFSLLIT